MLVEKYGWAVQKNLPVETNQDSTFPHIHENSKKLNIALYNILAFNINILAFLTINHLHAESCI